MAAPTVPCTDCGQPTPNTACKCCDACLVVRYPIDFDDPVALRKVAVAVESGLAAAARAEAS